MSAKTENYKDWQQPALRMHYVLIVVKKLEPHDPKSQTIIKRQPGALNHQEASGKL